MASVITESGMDFVCENTFHIEQSALYSKYQKHGIKSVEFIRIIEDFWLYCTVSG